MDFRLKVFHTVASRLSFTKAASELFISQPAVSKHIKELEQELNSKLFERKGNTITLTAAGIILKDNTLPIFEIYRTVETQIAALSGQIMGLLRIGASTTVAQYVLPKMLAGFRRRYPTVTLQVKEANTEEIENEILNKGIDVAIIEGHTKRAEISYTPFLKDELVLVCSSHNPLTKKMIITKEQVLQQKFVLREEGSGTLDVIKQSLKQIKITLADIEPEIRLNSSESIKSYITHSDCIGVLSVHAIHNELKNNTLTILDIEGLSMQRYFKIVTLQGKPDILAEKFIKYALSNQKTT